MFVHNQAVCNETAQQYCFPLFVRDFERHSLTELVEKQWCIDDDPVVHRK